ncbi:MAG: DUF599 domain-containing protein [Geminicoccaceae bacterium]|nr:DUF599 domain-containing protein [Geminicoccaceae bacterium]
MNLAEIQIADLLAFAFFLASWIGYALFADILKLGKASLMERMHEYRSAWTRQMLERDNRMVDIQVVNVLVNNVRFFASSNIFIIGGLVAVFGAAETARSVIAEMPFATPSPKFLFDLKLMLLMVIFVYAFFKFTWSLRQFNYVAILIGATPDGISRESIGCAERLANIATRAADHFNRAMRAFYFGLAALVWFVQPSLFMLATIWVVLIVYRREYRSKILESLGPLGTPISQLQGNADSLQSSRR